MVVAERGCLLAIEHDGGLTLLSDASSYTTGSLLTVDGGAAAG
jgi:hypothetical protein